MPIIISITLQSRLTALMLAASRGHTAVVRELLTRQDLNINMTDKVHPVQKTTFSPTQYNNDNYYYIISYLSLVMLYSYTQMGQTAVFRASAKGHSDVVKLLVQAGADLELQHKVHTLWERFMLAHTVCDIAAWNKIMTFINVLIMKVPAGT